jgi:hypothetical protein
MNVYHAVFSSQFAENYGYAIYKSADGTEVMVSSVDIDKENLLKNFNWSDKIYVGEVVKFISSNIKVIRTAKRLTSTPTVGYKKVG